MPVSGLKIGKSVVYIDLKKEEGTFKFIHPKTNQQFGRVHQIKSIRSNPEEYIAKNYYALLSLDKVKKPIGGGLADDLKNQASLKGLDVASDALKMMDQLSNHIGKIGNNYSEETQKQAEELTRPLVLLSSQSTEVFGNADAKDELLDNLQNPSMFPLIFKTSKGILLFGTPGNGKTAVVRWAVSKMKNTVFFAPNPGQIMSYYQGETEKNLNRLFQAASDAIGKPPPKEKVKGSKKISKFKEADFSDDAISLTYINELTPLVDLTNMNLEAQGAVIKKMKESEYNKEDLGKIYSYIHDRLPKALIKKDNLPAKSVAKSKKIEQFRNDVTKAIIAYAYATSDIAEPEYKISLDSKTGKEEISEEPEIIRRSTRSGKSDNTDPKDLIRNSVIFFDEIDGLVKSREGEGQESGGSSVLSTLLDLMDGIRARPGVIVIAATNKPWQLDEALLRRLGKRIFIDLPDENAISGIVRNSLSRYAFPSKIFDYQTNTKDAVVYPENFDPIEKNSSTNPNNNNQPQNNIISKAERVYNFVSDTKFIKMVKTTDDLESFSKQSSNQEEYEKYIELKKEEEQEGQVNDFDKDLYEELKIKFERSNDFYIKNIADSSKIPDIFSQTAFPDPRNNTIPGIAINDGLPINDKVLELIVKIMRGKDTELAKKLQEIPIGDQSKVEEVIESAKKISVHHRPRSGAEVETLLTLTLKNAAKRAFYESHTKGLFNVISRPDLVAESEEQLKSDKSQQQPKQLLYLVSDEWMNENTGLLKELEKKYPKTELSLKKFYFEKKQLRQLDDEEKTRLINMDIRVMDFAYTMYKFPPALNVNNYVETYVYDKFNQ